MELPFAVDASPPDDASSLVTDSSQGSLVPADDLNLSQQHEHAVFSVQTEPLTPPRREPQPEQPVFRPTIAELPPPPPIAAPLSMGAASLGVDALKSAGSRVSSVLSHFGYNRSSNQQNNNSSSNSRPSATNSTQASNPTPPSHKGGALTASAIDEHPDTEAIEFAYINVTDEDEVDIWLDDSNTQYYNNNGDDVAADSDVRGRADILTVLLQGDASSGDGTEQLVTWTEQANEAAARAVTAKREGNLQEALDRHSDAAKLFHEAAVLVRERDASMANSLLLLSQTQAKSALALKRIVKLRPNALSSTFQNNNRLRATVRGALNSKPEADISDSAFLGKATKPPMGTAPQSKASDAAAAHNDEDSSENPVDEMMELERELRDMDMALALGSSIASLDARTQNRMKNSVSESFMVVPGAGSYMSSSSSIILGPAGGGGRPSPSVGGGTAGVRARANRVQSLARPAHNALLQQQQQQQQPPQSVVVVSPPSASQPKIQAAPPPPQSLESSWWGNASMASQVLSASVISLASGGPGQMQQQQQHQQPANTKQLMRLMDSLRTLGDENAALLREVEDAEAARMEAKAAREQMKRFKEEYGKRFAALKEALENFRKRYPDDNATSGELNPVTSSDFSRSASTSDQLQRQEQLIRKLTADLKKEKEEGKKKDGALRKYESFYREVKARSAQKAAQRQQQQTQQAQPNRAAYRGSVR